ncbi:HAD family hydrolase [Aquamicrobium segne]|uniref:HAD family hydrolase n=1 Tax=Aquamicrobium segne TaxID=469547 RepID=A0ABW0H2H5_9HYPH
MKKRQTVTGSQLIIFDCDGVLVDSEPLAVLAYERVYERHGMPGVGLDIISQCFGMKQADIIARIAELTGHHYPDHAPDDLWLETKALFSEQLQPISGLPDFLSNLKIQRCVASSSSLERIHHSLDVTSIASYFDDDAIFSSSMVRHGKPAPDIFLFAAEKMGMDPAKSAVIEDSPFGIQGAVAAGMAAIGFTGGSHSYEGHAERLLAAGAHAVCTDWAGVAAELEKRGFQLI